MSHLVYLGCRNHITSSIFTPIKNTIIHYSDREIFLDSSMITHLEFHAQLKLLTVCSRLYSQKSSGPDEFEGSVGCSQPLNIVSSIAPQCNTFKLENEPQNIYYRIK